MAREFEHCLSRSIILLILVALELAAARSTFLLWATEELLRVTCGETLHQQRKIKSYFIPNSNALRY